MHDLLILAIAPAVFLFLCVYAKDRYEPEPLHLLFWIFLLGACTTIPAALIESPFPDGVFTSAIVAPVVEESLKFLVVFLFIYRHAEFDKTMDGIVYAMAAALGFATVENIFYVLDGGLAVGIIRAVASVPGHVIFSCIWGAALGIAKFRPEQERTGIILTGLLGAMLLHGIFNYSLEVLDVSGLLLILLAIIPLGWWLLLWSIRCAHEHPASWCSAVGRGSVAGADPAGTPAAGITIPARTGPAATENPEPRGKGMFCTACGAPIKDTMHFCENCGKRL